MSKQDLNQLTGHDFFQARENIGITMKVVYDRLGINRNKLSQFEQEKGTLPANEKRALKRFYEERGHDFAEPEEIDGKGIAEHYEETKEVVTETIELLMPNEVGKALVEFINAHHDVIAGNAYIDWLRAARADQEKTETMPSEHQELTANLIHHFEADKQGKFAKKGGLLGGAGQERGQKIMALLAHMKLQDLQRLRPDVLSLSLKTVDKNSDNERLLDEIKDNLNLGSLEEFKQYTPALVK